jgi:hypothetical protein
LAGDGLSWFYSLLMDDRIALLADPYQELSARLIDRLIHQPGDK